MLIAPSNDGADELALKASEEITRMHKEQVAFDLDRKPTIFRADFKPSHKMPVVVWIHHLPTEMKIGKNLSTTNHSAPDKSDVLGFLRDTAAYQTMLSKHFEEEKTKPLSDKRITYRKLSLGNRMLERAGVVDTKTTGWRRPEKYPRFRAL
jgi:spore maturation protein CgeB